MLRILVQFVLVMETSDSGLIALEVNNAIETWRSRRKNNVRGPTLLVTDDIVEATWGVSRKFDMVILASDQTEGATAGIQVVNVKNLAGKLVAMLNDSDGMPGKS